MSDRLASARAALAYQREWFAELGELARDGTPIALVNADTPHEILRAMEIPYVVNQWWASVLAAKGRGARYLDLLRHHGYPDSVEQYSALSLGFLFDPSPHTAPMGGLPTPSLVVAETTGDAGRKIFDVWGDQPGIVFHALESTAENEVPLRWWTRMPHQWEEIIGSDRIDLIVSELRGLIRSIEVSTGRTFSETRFAEVMRLANEQHEWNRHTRDLVAQARPCPVHVTDSMPSVMVPQWHRGTVWARDAARALYEEVAERYDAGTVCSPERARLMWVGRGLWFDLDLYRRFERSHGAVFVWSMYLAIAADGYIRYGDDPLRALAARFAAFSDQLYTPPWSSEWYVKEARHHCVDGVIHLVSDDERGGYFTTRAPETAGIPVLELHTDNVDGRGADTAALETRLGEWIEEIVLPRT